jgi:aspartate oxidase
MEEVVAGFSGAAGVGGLAGGVLADSSFLQFERDTMRAGSASARKDFVMKFIRAGSTDPARLSTPRIGRNFQ